MAEEGFFRTRRLNWWMIALLALLHLAALFGLARLFAPEITGRLIEQASSLVTVTVSTYEADDEPKAPEPDEGASGEAGKEATAREVAAPENPVPRPSQAPQTASTGNANASGATDAGEGTGAAGEGEGTGSGNGGQGRGGGIAVGPSVRSGSIDSARDFPIPEGGRQVRDGTSVTVVFTVGTDGIARDCSVRNPGPDPATNALVCPLVIERIRFNPARDAEGNPVPARYGWRQDFFRR